MRATRKDEIILTVLSLHLPMNTASVKKAGDSEVVAFDDRTDVRVRAALVISEKLSKSLDDHVVLAVTRVNVGS